MQVEADFFYFQRLVAASEADPVECEDFEALRNEGGDDLEGGRLRMMLSSRRVMGNLTYVPVHE